MTKKLLLLVLTLITCCQVFAQNDNSLKSEFYINVFINADKDVFVESQKTDYSKVTTETKEILNNHPFKLDETIIFRIFADESLDLGYIMDVNQQMIKASSENFKTQRHLLNAVQLNIDGENWFESKKIKELKAK
jgi:hypothetical protein